MKIYKDGSATLDKWDICALGELLKKSKSFRGKQAINIGTFKDEEVNQMREKITKTPIHKIWFWLKYPLSKKGVENIEN